MNPEPIRLKRKHQRGKQYKVNKSSSNHSGQRHRTKLGQAAKNQLPPQRQRVLLLKDGRTRMIDGGG